MFFTIFYNLLQGQLESSMGEASISNMRCRSCSGGGRVVRVQWIDRYPEGSTWYDDHVCLECGAYADQPGACLGEASLVWYRKKYGHIVGIPEPDEGPEGTGRG